MIIKYQCCWSGSTNYERVMEFLETSRAERHKIGPEEIRDWRKEIEEEKLAR